MKDSIDSIKTPNIQSYATKTNTFDVIVTRSGMSVEDRTVLLLLSIILYCRVTINYMTWKPIVLATCLLVFAAFVFVFQLKVSTPSFLGMPSATI